MERKGDKSTTTLSTVGVAVRGDLVGNLSCSFQLCIHRVHENGGCQRSKWTGRRCWFSPQTLLAPLSQKRHLETIWKHTEHWWLESIRKKRKEKAEPAALNTSCSKVLRIGQRESSNQTKTLVYVYPGERTSKNQAVLTQMVNMSRSRRRIGRGVRDLVGLPVLSKAIRNKRRGSANLSIPAPNITAVRVRACDGNKMVVL